MSPNARSVELLISDVEQKYIVTRVALKGDLGEIRK